MRSTRHHLFAAGALALAPTCMLFPSGCAGSPPPPETVADLCRALIDLEKHGNFNAGKECHDLIENPGGAGSPGGSQGPGTIVSHACAADATAFWPSTVMPIPVCWENPTSNDQDARFQVREAVRDTWERWSQVRFADDWPKCAPGVKGIHIIIADVNPASGVGMTELNGVTASLKNDPAGAPLQVLDGGMVLNFDMSAWPPATAAHPTSGVTFSDARPRTWFIKVIATHEFGHALGFLHEQGRASTPVWCTDRDTNGERPCNAEEGQWDANSIMSYCSSEYTNGGELSEIDKRMLQKKYGAPTSACLPGETACGAGCAYLDRDVENCGACGNTCPASQRCDQGACACPVNYGLCGGTCKSIRSNTNCGSCGKKCGSGTHCDGKKCIPNAACNICTCPDGFVAGPDSCENTTQCRDHICRAHGPRSGHEHSSD
ncbi:hypothetical protein WMF45_41190 [Sorangium sp. So ce448]|uniref:hypothetical protein n=1 Tax=Sorangium sp. So ce448 TaxID=3133314 RepID=UPI003F626958